MMGHCFVVSFWAWPVVAEEVAAAVAVVSSSFAPGSGWVELVVRRRFSERKAEELSVGPLRQPEEEVHCMHSGSQSRIHRRVPVVNNRLALKKAVDLCCKAVGFRNYNHP